MQKHYSFRTDWQNWLLAVLFIIGGIIGAILS